MRLLTFNIHGCIGRHGVLDRDRVLAVIGESGADVVALQEVYSETRQDRTFLHRLREALPYHHVIHGVTMRNEDADYGNVLMSRIPFESEERIDLSQGTREPRGAIRVGLRHRGRSFLVTATHLGLSPRERLRQIRRLAAESHDDPDRETIRILLGDLNDWFPFGRARRVMRQFFGDAKGPGTFPAWCPVLALDRVHVKPDSVRVHRRTLQSRAARTASDHLPLVADLAFS